MIYANPHNVTLLAPGQLDHPEGLCLTPEGNIFAGSESGKIYRLRRDDKPEIVADTGGFVLGMALDGNGQLHVCDSTRPGILRIDPQTGQETPRTGGVTPAGEPLVPNYAVFDAAGNLFVSHSGDYWHDTGTGLVYVLRPDDSLDIFHAGPFRFANGLALSPDGCWLYVAQSTAANIVRIPTDRPNGPIEVVATLPEHTVPDGIVVLEDGSFLITCYRPDIIYHCSLQGGVLPIIEDRTHELLISPTNGALDPSGRLYLANLGGWHLSMVQTMFRPATLHYPVLPVRGEMP